MNAVRKEACEYRMDSPWWQLAENLNGRIARSIFLVDDGGGLARELAERGVSVERTADYRMLCPSVPGNGLEGALMELEPRKLKELLRRCSTQLVLVVGQPEEETRVEEGGVSVAARRRRSILSMLDGFNVNYSYKTVLSGDAGCFVVDGLGPV